MAAAICAGDIDVWAPSCIRKEFSWGGSWPDAANWSNMFNCAGFTPP